MAVLNTLYHRVVRQTLVPLVLMVSTPNVALLFPYLVVHRKASLIHILHSQSLLQLLRDAWLSVEWFDHECWAIVLGTLLWGIFTMLILPGKKYYGPPTPNNYRPQYWDNGFRFYLLSMAITVWFLSQHSVLHLYYKIPTLIGILCLFGFVFCGFLYLKALVAPDQGLHDMTMNPIFDFYWGIELYPQLGTYISLKVLINCRFGLWLWQLIVLVAWKANQELYSSHYMRGQIVWPITVSTILQTVYLAKFYYWESGYMQTIDTSVDRFGYMIAWGCIAFVPGFYTLASVYLVKNSPSSNWDAIINGTILTVGIVSIFTNYWVDYQRQLVRQTDGRCTIWFQKPVLIRAKYQDDKGVDRNSVLLASGFWGVARHFNYFFELLVALSFGLPALVNSPLPYFYFVFLFVLLVHRAIRDDDKCLAKYGRYWKQYCQLVPYKILPYVF